MEQHKTFRILQVNCQGFVHKDILLQQTAAFYEADIIFMQEHFCTEVRQPRLPSYQTFYSFRTHTAGGGTAILTHVDIAAELLCLSPFPQIFEVTTVKITLRGRSICLCSLYWPHPSVEDADKVTSFLRSLSLNHEHLIVCGDFNCHHPEWGGYFSTVGDRLLSTINELGLHILNDPSQPTYFCHSDEHRNSVLDLTIVSPSMRALVAKWTTCDDNISDHCPVLTEFHIPLRREQEQLRPHVTWRIPEDWQPWQEACQYELNHWLMQQVGDSDIGEAADSFTHTLIELAKTIIGEKKIFPTSKAWWHGNTRVQELIRQSRRARRRSQRHRTSENRKHANFMRKQCQSAIQAAKQQVWNQLCTQIRDASNPKAFYSLYKKSTGVASTTIPALKIEDGKTAVTAKQKAQALNEHFCAVSKACERPPHAQLYLQTHHSDFQTEPSGSELDVPDAAEMNELFTMSELSFVMQQLALHPNKAPGADRITHPMITHGGPAMNECLLYLYNKSWCAGRLPEIWKVAKVHPIPKKDKDLGEISSYRPISLLSSLAKTMERMVTRRLMCLAVRNNWISEFQSAFRSSGSTLDHLTRLCNDVWTAFEERKTVTLVMADIHKAYDTVWRDGLRVKLHKLGIRGRMLRWLSDFLKNRRQFVVVNGEESSECEVDEGVPQGSALSPLLFLLSVNDCILDHGSVRWALYADDVALWHSAPSHSHSVEPLNVALAHLDQWAALNGFRFSFAKNSFTVFQKQPVVFDEDVVFDRIHMAGHIVRYEPEPTLLGLTLDRSLSFKSHIQRIAQRCCRQLGLISRVCSSKYGSVAVSCAQALQLYKANVRSILDYAAPLYSAAAQSSLSPLYNVQRKALLIATGARRTTSTLALEVECLIEPLHLRWLKLTLFWYSKIWRLPTSHPLRIQTHQLLPRVKVSPWFNSFLQRCRYNDATPSSSSVPLRLLHSNVERVGRDEHLPLHSLHERFPDLIVRENYDDITPLVDWHERMDEYILKSDAACAWTDGSYLSSTDQAGAAVLFQHSSLNEDALVSYQIGLHSSAQAAEVTAVAKAVGLYLENDFHRARIPLHLFHDCVYIQDLLFKTPRASKSTSWFAESLFFDAFETLLSQKVPIFVHWIPAHSGLAPHDEVDQAAKDAAHADIDFEHSIPVTLTAAKRLASQAIMNVWQDEWKRSSFGRDFYYFKPELKTTKALWQGERKLACLRFQLRTGHCTLNDALFRFDLSDTDECLVCGSEPETVEHVFLRCPRYSSARRQLARELSKQNLEMSLRNILTCASMLQATNSFLKTIRRFDLSDADDADREDDVS